MQTSFEKSCASVAFKSSNVFNAFIQFFNIAFTLCALIKCEVNARILYFCGYFAVGLIQIGFSLFSLTALSPIVFHISTIKSTKIHLLHRILYYQTCLVALHLALNLSLFSLNNVFEINALENSQISDVTTDYSIFSSIMILAYFTNTVGFVNCCCIWVYTRRSSVWQMMIWQKTDEMELYADAVQHLYQEISLEKVTNQEKDSKRVL